MNLYTTPTCGPCKRVKEHIELRGISADIVVIDEIEAFPQGLRSVPALEVGDELIIGDSKIIKYLETM